MSRALFGTVELDVTADRKPAPKADGDEAIVFSAKPELWFILPGPPKEWRYMFMADDDLAKANGGVECWGLTIPSLGVVLFAESLKLRKNRQILRVTFCHETFHVGVSNDGAEHTTRQAFGSRNEAVANAREEAVAGLWSNGVAHSLFAARVMRLPKLPKMRK